MLGYCKAYTEKDDTEQGEKDDTEQGEKDDTEQGVKDDAEQVCPTDIFCESSTTCFVSSYLTSVFLDLRHGYTSIDNPSLSFENGVNELFPLRSYVLKITNAI